ncbi:MAG: hypothetical protein OEY86_12575, partial [Nitrospira sp.]|nr:hypothetical protein [Nitrospira sp.]
ERTLGWVEESLIRLKRLTDDIVLTDLPLESVRRLSNGKFVAFRTALVPSCRLPLAHVIERAEQVNEGLAVLAKTYGARFFHLDPAWYGVDPIHIKPSLWRPAWQQILGAQPQTEFGKASGLEGMQLYLMRPERRWLFGREQITPQSGTVLRSGGKVWLY